MHLGLSIRKGYQFEIRIWLSKRFWKFMIDNRSSITKFLRLFYFFEKNEVICPCFLSGRWSLIKFKDQTPFLHSFWADKWLFAKKSGPLNLIKSKSQIFWCKLTSNFSWESKNKFFIDSRARFFLLTYPQSVSGSYLKFFSFSFYFN